MKSILQLAILLALFFSNILYSQHNEKIDGVIIPKSVVFSEKTLILNGVGIRNKFWSDLYTQALYLTVQSSNPQEILNSNSKMSMIFHITSKLVTAKNFSDRLNKGIKKTVGVEKWISFKPEMDLINIFLNTDKIVENDVFNLVYNDADTSVWVIKNGVVKGKVPGFEFKKALFGIWLSEKPVNESLKNNLLGLK